MLLIYTIIYFLAVFLYYIGLNGIASILVVALAIFLYLIEIFKKKRIINIRGLFALGFIGGFGISLLKLSNLSDIYDLMTFLVVYASYFAIYFGGYIADKNKNTKVKAFKKTKILKRESFLDRQDIFLIIFIIITFVSFIVEIVKLGFVPAFIKDTPHAYSSFHIYGLHYITTLYIFIPVIAICNYLISEKAKKDIIFVVVSYIYVIFMAMLLVSRAQLIMSIFISIFVVLIQSGDKIFLFISNKKWKSRNIIYVILLALAFIVIYLVITIARAHDTIYLNNIFDMKNKSIPIFITQPYMYIAHNFENLNYMIKNIFRHTFGRRVLYPLFTLTFVKKFFPIVVDSPYYIIKEELSTVTLVYDFYYDFGLAGVIIFCFIIGYVGKNIENNIYTMIESKNYIKNNYKIIVFALFSYYMFFSFFQAYFSLTDTWIYIVFLVIVSITFVMTKTNGKINVNEKRKEKGDNYENNKNEELRRDERRGSENFFGNTY